MCLSLNLIGNISLKPKTERELQFELVVIRKLKSVPKLYLKYIKNKLKLKLNKFESQPLPKTAQTLKLRLNLSLNSFFVINLCRSAILSFDVTLNPDLNLIFN